MNKPMISGRRCVGGFAFSLLALFAFGASMRATAVDTRDYSTYIKLKANTTLSNSV